MSAARSRLFLFALLVLASITTGCTSVVQDTGYLPGGYTEWNAVDKKGLKVRVNEDILAKAVAREEEAKNSVAVPEVQTNDGSTTRALVIIVPQPEWKSEVGFPKKPNSEQNILFTIRERTYRYFLRQYDHPVRVRYAYRRSDRLVREGRVITLEMAVTDVKRGQGIPRYILGYGVGQSRLQLEGQIYEGIGDEKKKVGEFAVRTAHGGYAQNGINVAVMSDEYVLRYAAEEAITHLSTTLPKYFEPIEKLPPPVLQPATVGGTAPVSPL